MQHNEDDAKVNNDINCSYTDLARSALDALIAAILDPAVTDEALRALAKSMTGPHQ